MTGLYYQKNHFPTLDAILQLLKLSNKGTQPQRRAYFSYPLYRWFQRIFRPEGISEIGARDPENNGLGFYPRKQNWGLINMFPIPG